MRIREGGVNEGYESKPRLSLCSWADQFKVLHEKVRASGEKGGIPMTAKLIVSQDYVCSDCMDSLDQRECDDCGELFNFEDVDHEIGCLNNGERHICSSCLEERRE